MGNKSSLSTNNYINIENKALFKSLKHELGKYCLFLN